MGKLRSGLVAAVDVGSSKVCCFVANVTVNGDIRVLSAMHRESEGIGNGIIIDMESAQRAVSTVIAATENSIDERIETVFVNLSGGTFLSRIVPTTITVSGQVIADSHIAMAHQRSLRGEQPADMELMHSIPVDYVIDGDRGIRDPRNLLGEALEISFHQTAASASAVRNLENCVDRCHLGIEDMVVSPYASGLACLYEDEKDLGVTLIDMGGGTTTIATFYQGQVIFVDSVPVGGKNITHDIARGLSTSVNDAERLKILYGSALPEPSAHDETIEVRPLGEDDNHTVPVRKSLLIGIMGPRIEETFELVRERLEMSGTSMIAGRTVVLTGGASQVPNLSGLAESVLEKQVSVRPPLGLNGVGAANSGPAFATCAGLLRYAVEKTSDNLEITRKRRQTRTRPLAVLGQWLRESF